MLNDPPKEPARETAKRRWSNADVERRFKDARQKYAPDDPDNPFETRYGKKQKPTAPPAVEVIENEAQPKAQKLETKFIKNLRAMLNEHKHISMAAYIAVTRHQLRQQKRRLLLEKLRRLEVSIAQREGALK